MVIEFTQRSETHLEYHFDAGSPQQIDFTPAQVIGQDDQSEQPCLLNYFTSVTPDSILSENLLLTTCENDSCHLTIDPSFGNPGDAYEVNVNACTSDGMNCESLAFKINFIEETFDAQTTTQLPDVTDPMSWNVEIS